MPYLIVGLGNIGPEYHNTRHNVGFDAVSALAEKMGITFTTQRYGDVAKGRIKNAELVLLKPSTYMNLSGKAVRYYQQELNIPVQNILVVVDDLAIPFGSLRLKASGSDGGHNGLKSINECLGNTQYPRLRIGLGSDYPKGAQIDFVLGHFNDEEKKYLPLVFEEAVAAIKDFALAGVARAMNAHNKSVLPAAPDPQTP